MNEQRSGRLRGLNLCCVTKLRKPSGAELTIRATSNRSLPVSLSEISSRDSSEFRIIGAIGSEVDKGKNVRTDVSFRRGKV